MRTTYPVLHEAVAAAQACVRVGSPVTLASGSTSDVYIDLRPQLLKFRDPITEAVVSIFPWMDVPKPVAGGLEFGGIPLAMAVSYRFGYDAVAVRSSAKSHGTGSRVVGDFSLQDRQVILLEDVVTTGRSVLDAVDALRAEGWLVAAVVAAVDRGGGSAVAAVLPFSAVLSMNNDGQISIQY